MYSQILQANIFNNKTYFHKTNNLSFYVLLIGAAWTTNKIKSVKSVPVLLC